MNVGSALNTLGKSMIGQGMAFIKTRVGAVVGVPFFQGERRASSNLI